MEAIVALIGTATALVTLVPTNFIAKQKALELERRKIMEDNYVIFLKALSDVVVLAFDGPQANAARDRDSDAQNKLLLVASVEVVRRLMAFYEYIKPSAAQAHPDMVRHDRLLGALIQAMRYDMFGKKGCDNFPPIHFIGKTNTPVVDNRV